MNWAAAAARGTYLLKCDAHCLFMPGYDEALKAECDGDWLVVPRRYNLEIETWERAEGTAVDYHYLSCPWNNPSLFIMHASPWFSRDRARANVLLDETMALQGSAWFTTARHFHERMHGMSEERGTSPGEALETALKTWLSGGRVMVNKEVWYAHWHKGGYRRGYRRAGHTTKRVMSEIAQYWTRNQWEYRARSFDWLIDHFWPLPTEASHVRNEKHRWIENWRELYDAAL